MEKTALLVVDVQEALVAKHPWREEEFIASLRRLVALCRKNGTEEMLK